MEIGDRGFGIRVTGDWGRVIESELDTRRWKPAGRDQRPMAENLGLRAESFPLLTVRS